VKTEFQSGDFQRMLKVPKQRIDYLAIKIPLPPDILQVDGTGRANRYSFRNAIQFTIADRLNRMGCNPQVIRTILSIVDRLAEEEDFFLYDPNPEEVELGETKLRQARQRQKQRVDVARDAIEFHYTLSFVAEGKDVALRLSGAFDAPRLGAGFYALYPIQRKLEHELERYVATGGGSDSAEEKASKIDSYNKRLKEVRQKVGEVIDADEVARDAWRAKFEISPEKVIDAHAYQALNLGSIKKTVLDYAKEA
jgi:hypothetical protein